MESNTDLQPLFCVKTTDKITGQTLFINFKSSDAIEAPAINIEEEKLIREICEPSPEIERYKVPLQLSQIFWSGSDTLEEYGKIGPGSRQHEKGEERNYVIDVQLNDKFAFRKVIASEIIRHYVITVTMVSIEEKFNHDLKTNSRSAHQYLGHKLELDQAGYEILKSPLQIKRSNEVVTNKIVLMDSGKEITYDSFMDKCDIKADKDDQRDDTGIIYDLHFRPAIMVLTCSISTDKLPNSISFNDDRVKVELNDTKVLDVHLPLDIDLSEPVKYKFDDRLCLFRMVLKLKEPPLEG